MSTGTDRNDGPQPQEGIHVSFEAMSMDDLPPVMQEAMLRAVTDSGLRHASHTMNEIMREFEQETDRVIGQFVRLHNKMLYDVRMHLESPFDSDSDSAVAVMRKFMQKPGAAQLKELKRLGAPASVLSEMGQLKDMRDILVHADYSEHPMWLRGVTPEPAWWKTSRGEFDSDVGEQHWFTLAPFRAAIIEMRLCHVPSWLRDSAAASTADSQAETSDRA